MADYKETLDFIDSDDEVVDENLLKYKVLLSRHQAIEQKLASGWTHEKFVSKLNSTGMDISLDTFRTYLYRMRKANPKIQKQTAKKITAQPHRVASPERSDEPEAPGADWTDLEKLVGYRLSDEIREYVSAKDKRVVENFPKGHRRSAEARGELTVLRRDLSRT